MNTNFPKSIFNKQTLKKIAGNFDIPAMYYDNSIPKREFSALNYKELQNIWRETEHPITADEMIVVVGTYNMMTRFDAYFLCTRLPLKVLSRILNMKTHMAAALKRACNYLRDMTDVEYRARDKRKPVYRYFKYSDAMAGYVQGVNSTHPIPSLIGGSISANTVPYEFADNKDDIIRKIRPYMNAKAAERMPTTVRLIVQSTPKHVLKRLWTGKGFEQFYNKVTSK